MTQKLSTATHKLVQLTDQNTLLHQALKRAKDHIKHQEKSIQKLSSKRDESNQQVTLSYLIL